MEGENLKKIFESSSDTLEKSINTIERAEKNIISKKPFRVAEEYVETLGPGLITGAADDDPSGVATYSQVGAQFGFGFLWAALFSFPLMSVVQEMCAKIALVTGRGLAANIHHLFSKRILYICVMLLFIANTLNIAADLSAMAASAQLVLPWIPFSFALVGFAIISLLLQIFTTYARYSKYLKYMTFALFAYIIVALSSHIDWSTAFKATIIPHLSFSKDSLLLLCAIFGTTISPYLFFWQSSQEIEEEILKGETTVLERKKEFTDKEEQKMKIDVWSGMFFSNAIMFFIIAACGATLFGAGIYSIGTVADAAKALIPLAGNFAGLIFSIGVVGTGMLALPVLAGSSSYAFSEAFGWKYGLYRKLHDARAFYGVVIMGMLIGLGIGFTNIDPIKLLIITAVVNGIISPVLIFFIVRIATSHKGLGSHRYTGIKKYLGWLAFFVMCAVSIGALYSLI